MTTGTYINSPGFEVPENKILVVPYDPYPETFREAIKPLKGNIQRDWFTPHFYYCLPLTIGNQYGFGVYSLSDIDITWNGKESDKDVQIEELSVNSGFQVISSHFGSGVVSIQHRFHLKTPPGINLMTIQPPNFYIPGICSMTGVIETDNLRRDFTFNMKVTIPNFKISIRKGDLLSAFIPIPRGHVDKYEIDSMYTYFGTEFFDAEMSESKLLSYERDHEDINKNHFSGRRYFSGTHMDGTKYLDHQKRLD